MSSGTPNKLIENSPLPLVLVLVWTLAFGDFKENHLWLFPPKADHQHSSRLCFRLIFKISFEYYDLDCLSNPGHSARGGKGRLNLSSYFVVVPLFCSSCVPDKIWSVKKVFEKWLFYCCCLCSCCRHLHTCIYVYSSSIGQQSQSPILINFSF